MLTKWWFRLFNTSTSMVWCGALNYITGTHECKISNTWHIQLKSSNLQGFSYLLVANLGSSQAIMTWQCLVIAMPSAPWLHHTWNLLLQTWMWSHPRRSESSCKIAVFPTKRWFNIIYIRIFVKVLRSPWNRHPCWLTWKKRSCKRVEMLLCYVM